MKILNNAVNTRRRSLLCHCLLLASLLTAALPGRAETQMIDQVVAIVDDDVVLASELRERLQVVKRNLQKGGREMPPEADIQREILDQLILENLQLQMANRAGVRISDAQLNEALGRIAAQNGMNLEQFRAALERDGMSYTATREQIRREMLIQRVQQGNVSQRVQITDQEIANFLDSEEGRAITAPEYRLLHTLIPVSSDADAAQQQRAEDYAGQLYQRIQRGEDYQAVVDGQHSIALNSSDLGWRKTSELPGMLAELAPTLGEGNTAEPIQSASGFHLVKMAGKRGEGEVIPQTRARHILLKPSAIRDDAATERAIKRLRQRIIDGESFAELAREHSEDIGSAVEGGDLGWTSPGQLVGAFQDAMDNTPIDGISPAFRSEYGWHILQVQERREKDITDDLRKRIARNHIHQRKYEDELQTWLQKIRDEAYVDFK